MQRQDARARRMSSNISNNRRLPPVLQNPNESSSFTPSPDRAGDLRTGISPIPNTVQTSGLPQSSPQDF